MSFFQHPSSVIDEGARIGDGSCIWHFCHISGSSVIGRNCILGQNVYLGPHVQIGDNVKIQNNVSVYEGVCCEDDVFLGPSVVFTNIKSPRSPINRKNKFVATIVRKGATIGANATIVCGNEVGAYSFIGAGAVVTKPVLPYALVTGNPAQQTGWVSEYGHKLVFDENGNAICRESGESYRMESGRVTRIRQNDISAIPNAGPV